MATVVATIDDFVGVDVDGGRAATVPAPVVVAVSVVLGGLADGRSELRIRPVRDGWEAMLGSAAATGPTPGLALRALAWALTPGV